MNQERDNVITGDEISLRDLLSVLLQKWWVVGIVFVVAVAGATAFSFRISDAFETQTILLLETSSPLEIFSTSATSDPLLEAIISEINLGDASLEAPLSVQQLESMIKVDSQTIGQRGSQITSHLFTLTVQGKNPELLKPITDKWATLFIEQSRLLFVAQASRSYDVVFSQYQGALMALRAKEDEKLAYQQANPLVADQSQFRALTAQYEDFLRQSQGNQAALIEAQSGLKIAEEALVGEPRFLTLERAFSTEGILNFFANSTGEQAMDGVSDLVVTDQEQNPVHFRLKGDIVSLRVDIARLEANIAYLESRTTELETFLEQRSGQVEETQLDLSRLNQDIKILNANVNQLGKSLQDVQIVEGEQSESIQIIEPAVDPRAPLPKRNRRQFLLAGAVLGILVGVALAFLVHYLQNPPVTRQED